MRRNRRSRWIEPGTYSEGTLRPEDTFPAFVDAVRNVRLSRADRSRVRALEAEFDARDGEDNSDIGEHGEILAEIADEILNILADYTPPGHYFGTVEGDGACFGCYPRTDCAALDCDADADAATLDRADRYAGTGAVLRVSDHGNVLGVWEATYDGPGGAARWRYWSV